LWGLNFTSIYPVLKLLHTNKSPQAWIDERLAVLETEIDTLKAECDRLTELEKELDGKPATKPFQQQRQNLAADLPKLEGKLESARSRYKYYLLAHKYIHSYVPGDSFQTLALVVALVFVGVAIKCVFEFAQEWLVGSVVNLSLFDLRNRFFRNVIRLDLDQF